MGSPSTEQPTPAGPRILWCATDRAALVAIERATRGASVTRAPSLDGLAALGRQCEPHLIIADLANEPVAVAASTIARLKRDHPQSYLLGHVSYARTSGRDLAELARAGLDAISLRESGALAGDIEVAMQRASRPAVIGRLVDQTVLGALHPLTAPAVQAITASAAWPNVAQLSRQLGCSPRELQRRYAAQALGRPHTLLRLARWRLVAEAMADGLAPRAAGVIAGFPGAAAMRAALRRDRGEGLEGLATTRARAHLDDELRDAFG